MNIMTSWVTLDELEGGNTRRRYKGRYGEYLVKKSNISRHLDFPFFTVIRYTITKIGANLIYHWIVHGIPIFWVRNFSWHIVMTEVNTTLASGHFQNGGDIMPNLDLGGHLAIQCMINNFGTEPGDIGRPMWYYRRPQIVEYNLEKVPNYHRKWLASEKNQNVLAEIS